MKKALLLLPFLLVIAIFITSKNKPLEEDLDLGLTACHAFHFITIYNDKDTFSNQKICSMVDQSYDNFQIHLFIDPKNSDFISAVKVYAKKAGKSHFLDIIHLDSEMPVSACVNQKIEEINSDDILVFLDTHCMFSDEYTLRELNKVFTSSPSTKLVYANHTSFPSLQVNQELSSFSSCSLKTLPVGTYLDYNSENSDGIQSIITTLSKVVKDKKLKHHYIKEPIYLKAR